MNSVYSPATQFEPIPRRWTTMTASALLHAAAFSGVVALAAATVSVVAPVDDREVRFVHVVAPPPPMRVPVRLPPVVREPVKVIELAVAPVAIPEPVIPRPEPPAPAPEARPEPAIEPVRPKTP